MTLYLEENAPLKSRVRIASNTIYFLAHLSRRLTRRAYSMVVDPASVGACVRACVHTFNLEYL